MKKTVWRIALGGLGAVVLVTTSAFAYVSLTYQRDFSRIPLPNIKASQDPQVIAHGAYVANALAHCSACHGNGESTNKYELPADPKDLRGGDLKSIFAYLRSLPPTKRFTGPGRRPSGWKPDKG